ncbi:uncharacterized protein ColSpa_09923 [Colletotrichum spaethianum]|uniref:Uncharacterized protein n=1 Tax=Colletotrichum spaethianum TaxID=700344 RepID=A0AA37UQZ4_9PEZI|nr:uncharacterized protein ColSpa_09923 [Colletotrichum spaethianum]GKT49742.1 hypothetical protein ColSpa_09923 [Colletotrichum spaethianum]
MSKVSSSSYACPVLATQEIGEVNLSLTVMNETMALRYGDWTYKPLVIYSYCLESAKRAV